MAREGLCGLDELGGHGPAKVAIVAAVFDHVTIRVADMTASERFYETTLGAAGIGAPTRGEHGTEWQDFSTARATADHPPTRRLHIGFSVASREHVRAFWDAGIEAGYAGDGEPGLRPEYTADYYGAFLLDPHGNSAEAVHHEGVRRSGNVDHVWMRVADLAASRSFYEAVAPEAGFRVNKEMPGRVAFVSDRPDGGDFSIVEGPPTENAHLAFPADGDRAALRDPDGNEVEAVGPRDVD